MQILPSSLYIVSIRSVLLMFELWDSYLQFRQNNATTYQWFIWRPLVDLSDQKSTSLEWKFHYFVWVSNRIEHVRYEISTSTCHIDIDMFYYMKKNTGDPIIMREGLGPINWFNSAIILCRSGRISNVICVLYFSFIKVHVPS
jgi:hypothetical protein